MFHLTLKVDVKIDGKTLVALALLAIKLLS